MRIHEYQTKALFELNGIPIARGGVADTVFDARTVAMTIGGKCWAVKAQIHAGGRGLAGGVRIVDSLHDLAESVSEMIGTRLVTHQTRANGLPVNHVLIEEVHFPVRDLYLSLYLDGSHGRLVFLCSGAGGMDIEQALKESPEEVHMIEVDPCVGLQPFMARSLGHLLGLEKSLLKQLDHIMQTMYHMFFQYDCMLLEINPLAIIETEQGHQLMALDGKLELDENAMYRHQDLSSLYDPEQEDPHEFAAMKAGLNYVALDGNIGCMVNGAGLAMATMDMILEQGGKPANFLDVGGGVNAAKVAEAFKIILDSETIHAIWVNIFGGIVQCNLIAQGIIDAAREVGLDVPLVVRLQGAKKEEGSRLLAESGLAIYPIDDLAEAAAKTVQLAAQNGVHSAEDQRDKQF